MSCAETPERPPIHVAAGVVLGADGSVLIAKRLPGVDQGGLWEFPGGKIEPGETARSALTRELHEELGIAVIEAARLIRIEHDYPRKRVVLDVWRVEVWAGTPAGAEGQQVKWVPLSALGDYAFPQANRRIITALADLAL